MYGDHPAVAREPQDIKGIAATICTEHCYQMRHMYRRSRKLDDEDCPRRGQVGDARGTVSKQSTIQDRSNTHALLDMETLATILLDTARAVNTEYATETPKWKTLRIPTSLITGHHRRPLISLPSRVGAISHDIRPFRFAHWILDECVVFHPVCDF